MKKIIILLISIVRFLGLPITFIASFWLKFIIRTNWNNKIEDIIFMKIGILPILDHYCQPLINPKKHLKKSSNSNRYLKGFSINIKEQLELLDQFNYNKELLKFPLLKTKNIEYYYNNGSYESGDAEYLYNMVRHFKPNKIIEIGSGYSTLMVKNANIINQSENPDYFCNHTCIEPYLQPWLEKIKVDLIREKVENIDISFFSKLESNDFLFIDSSHIIRPQGDVLFEYLELLPSLKSGVIVHIHDIFTPNDYPNDWLNKHILWNEQYLLEAFLTLNSEFKIIGALNFLSHNYRKEFNDKCPIFEKQPFREPGAFWLMKM